MGRPDEDESRVVFCHDCKEEVVTEWVDEGIGGYEFWGSRGTHSDWQEVCQQCEGQELSDNAPEGEGE